MMTPAQSLPGGPGSPGYMPSTFNTSLRGEGGQKSKAYSPKDSERARNLVLHARSCKFTHEKTPALGLPEVDADRLDCHQHLVWLQVGGRLPQVEWLAGQAGQGATGQGADLQQAGRRSHDAAAGKGWEGERLSAADQGGPH